ncbi:MAG: hypothetical protein WCB67_12750 [Solirubrobacteraceae bacterium]
MKRSIALGHILAAEVLLTCPGEAASWPIGELLMSQRRWGATRCRKFLSRNQIVETKPIGTLTERQRRILAAELQAASEAPRVAEALDVRGAEALDIRRVGELALAVA